MVLGFACSDTDLEGVDPATAPGEQSSSGNRVIEITAGSIESKMVVDDSGENTPITVTWNTSDVVGMWTYYADSYSTYDGLEKIYKGTITTLTNSGKTATFESAELAGDDETDMARLIYPYDAGSLTLSEGGTSGALSVYNINLSRQSAAIAPYSDGLAYENTHENMYMISDEVAIGESTTIRPITSLMRFYLTVFDSANTTSSINIYKVVCRKTQSSDTDKGSYIPVKVAVDLLAGIDPNNSNDVLTITSEGKIEVYPTNTDYSIAMGKQVCFTIPSLPITIDPNDKIYLDVYFTNGDSDVVYNKTCEYSPVSISGSTTMVAGIAYDLKIELDVDGAKDEGLDTEFNGLGTEASPYLIETETDLLNLASSVNNGEDYEGVKFKVSGDITASLNEAIGTEKYPFKGYFDGNGATINIINDCAGLFGYIYGVTIENLNIINTGSVTNGIAGGIVNYLGYNSSILNCSFSGNVTGTTSAGGLAGYSEGTIQGSYATGSVSGTNAAGLVGVNAGVLTNGFYDGTSYNAICASSTGTCDVLFYNRTNGHTGTDYGTQVVVTSFNSASFTDSINGELFTYNQGTLSRLYGWEVDSSSDSLYPARTTSYPSGELDSDSPTWNDLVTVTVTYDVLSSSLEGTGTSDDPFLIQSEYDLAMLSKYYFTNHPAQTASTYGDSGVYGKYYKLTKDLDLTGRIFVSIGVSNTVRWDSVFDGDGHTISGLYAVGQGQRSGLFKFVVGYDADNYAVIKNLYLKDYYLESTSNQCGLCASLGSYSIAANIVTTGSVTGLNTVGGVAGQAYGGIFYNCYSKSIVTTTNATPSRNGGITGYMSTASNMVGCYSNYTRGDSDTNTSGDDFAYGALIGGSQNGAAPISYSYWKDSGTSYEKCAFSNDSTYAHTTDDVDDSITNVTMDSSSSIVSKLNTTLSNYHEDYISLGVKACKWKVDDDGNVSLDFGNYLEGESSGTTIPGSGTNEGGGI